MSRKEQAVVAKIAWDIDHCLGVDFENGMLTKDQFIQANEAAIAWMLTLLQRDDVVELVLMHGTSRNSPWIDEANGGVPAVVCFEWLFEGLFERAQEFNLVHKLKLDRVLQADSMIGVKPGKIWSDIVRAAGGIADSYTMETAKAFITAAKKKWITYTPKPPELYDKEKPIQALSTVVSATRDIGDKCLELYIVDDNFQVLFAEAKMLQRHCDSILPQGSSVRTCRYIAHAFDEKYREVVIHGKSHSVVADWQKSIKTMWGYATANSSNADRVRLIFGEWSDVTERLHATLVKDVESYDRAGSGPVFVEHPLFTVESLEQLLAAREAQWTIWMQQEEASLLQPIIIQLAMAEGQQKRPKGRGKTSASPAAEVVDVGEISIVGVFNAFMNFCGAKYRVCGDVMFSCFRERDSVLEEFFTDEYRCQCGKTLKKMSRDQVTAFWVFLHGEDEQRKPDDGFYQLITGRKQTVVSRVGQAMTWGRGLSQVPLELSSNSLAAGDDGVTAHGVSLQG